MKMIRLCAWTVVLLTVFLTGCRKAGNYYDAIPADAMMVFDINVKNMLDKSGSADLLKRFVTQKMTGEENPKVAEKLIQIISEPESSGLALGEKTFFFIGAGMETVGLIAKVGKESELAASLEALKFGQIEKKSGYSQIVGKGAVAVYNESVLLACFNTSDKEGLEQKAKGWMEQKPEQSFAAKAEFQKFLALKGDMALMAPMEALLAAQPKNLQVSPMGVSLEYTKKMTLFSDFSFENGKMVMEIEMYASDKAVMDGFMEQSAVSRKVNNKFMERFPKDALLYVVSNLDGAKYYNLLSEMLKDDKSFQTLVANPLMQGDALQKMVSSIDGDFAMGISAFSAQAIPSFGIYAQVKDDALVKYLAGLKDMFGMMAQFTEINGNSYKVNIPMARMDVWFGTQNGCFYLSDEAASADGGPSPKDPLGSADNRLDVLKSGWGGFYINLEGIAGLPFVSAVPLAGMYLSPFTYLVGYNTSPLTGAIDLYAKDKDQNILKTLIQLFPDPSKQ